jgi:hypothetical protein
MTHMPKYKVTGKYEVGGAAPGETVELDPDKVNVSELVRVGLVEPLESEAVEHPADGTWSPEITGDGSGTALPPVEDQTGEKTAKVDRSGQTRSKAVKSVDQPGTGG